MLGEGSGGKGGGKEGAVGEGGGEDPANMYIWDPYGQNLGIYPIRVLHGPHIGFFAHIRPI